MRFADTAVVVTNPEVSSVRDSDRIIGLLDSKTERAEKGQRIDKHVLITRYDAQRAARGEMLNIADVLDILSTPLLGIIPESEEVLRASNLGAPVTINNTASAAARAYLDAARRLKGDDVPMSIPSGGISTSSTRLLAIGVKAPPMMTPTAMSTTSRDSSPHERS